MFDTCQKIAQVQLSRRAFCAAGLAGLALAAAAEQADSTKIKTLESAIGDVVRIEIEDRADDGVEDVILCLLNRTATDATGFDIRRGVQPRFVAASRGVACTRVTPGRHELFLWRSVDGRFVPVIQTTLDLSRAAGARALITW